MYTVMPDLISLPCEILFCVVFNRACPVLDTGATRGLAGFVYNHYLTAFPGPALDPDPGFAGMTGARRDATNGLTTDSYF